jgi:hypothetical protein
MASLIQGSPLPDVQTTQQTTSTAPAWYNNFLSSIPSTGAPTADTGVAGFSGLQQQAFGAAPSAINAGQGALGTAVNTATNVAGTPTIDMISQYMNPYTQQVIGEVGRLGQQNFQNKLAPGATAGAVGSGQFGSTRGMNVYGNIAREASRDITGQQGALLSSGFDAALKAAQAQQQLNLQAAQQLGTLSGQQYTQGVGGLDVLSKLGAQQQAQEQARIDYPLSLAERRASVLKGLQVPMSTEQTFKGPMPGAYAPSPLQQILGYTAGTASLFTPRYDKNGNPIPGSSPLSQIPGLRDLFSPSTPAAAPVYSGQSLPDGTPIYTKPDGTLVDSTGSPIDLNIFNPNESPYSPIEPSDPGWNTPTGITAGNNDSGFAAGNSDVGFNSDINMYGP